MNICAKKPAHRKSAKRFLPFKIYNLTTRQQLIRKLLTTFHLNMGDRQEFENNPVDIKEVKDIIRQDLEDKKVFPDTASIWKDGQTAFEGYFLERTGNNKYKLHWQRHQALNPFQLADSQVIDYDDFEKLVDDYIKREYNYSIDGLSIKSRKTF